MCWQWFGYVCPLSWDEVAKKCLWCLSLTKCYNAKHLDQSFQMKIPHFFSLEVFWVLSITTQISNKRTNQVFMEPPSSPPNHPNIQPSPPAKYAFSLPSIQPIYHSSIPPSQHNSLSRFSWEIKSVDDLFGVNNSLSRFLWFSLNQIVSLLDLSKSDNFIICLL